MDYDYDYDDCADYDGDFGRLVDDAAEYELDCLLDDMALEQDYDDY